MSVNGTEMALLQRFGQLNIRKKSPKSRIPLFKLPQLVLLECIENLDVLEILIFSLLSKRAKSTVKLIRWNPLDLRLKFEDDTHICLKFPSDPSREWVVDYDKESSYPYFQSTLKGPNVSRHLVLKDNGNAMGEIKQMIEHICEVFRSSICGIDIFEESLIEWVINLQSTIQYVSINDDIIISVQTLNRIFKNLKVTEFFRLGSIKTDQKFEITEPIPSRLVTIYKSYWFTLPAILNGRIWIIKYDDEYNSSEYPYFQSKLTGPKVVHYLLLKDDVGAIEDSKQMTEHICKVFHSPITDIQIGEESVIEWVVKFQPTIRCLLIPESVVISVETLDRILKNIKIKEFLMLGSVAKDKNIQIVEPIPPHSIIVCDSHWITLPSILNGTNSTIRLFGSKLTPMDINTILKEWQMGSKLRNLQYLEIDAVTLEDPHSFADETFQGLNVTRSRDNDGRPTTV
ncbi:hypothetical protein B9Z55_012339 [Caenorhabditis nigoni]|nr:hypothetical protein B9Z55_012339 [Caenorhabditis nigoni]